jgi:DNA gyrase subunit A
MAKEIDDTQKETEQEIVMEPGIHKKDIVEELTSSYINYAMSVIVSRALPDVRDGLKPVQRRILYSMHTMGIRPGTPFKKVARIVGDVIGKYHPHGDASVQDALVRMAQDWNLRYPLVEGLGNFGSIDGDPHAAMRYIEARLDKNSTEMLQDIAQRTVDFAENFDGEETEPTVLPNLLPNLLINGGEGIAVGMATKIPPHNLREVVSATISMINSGNSGHKEGVSKAFDYDKGLKNTDGIDTLPADRFPIFESEIEIKDLLKDIKGPDFPTAGVIYDIKEISNVYTTGRGRVLMRGVSRVEEGKGGKHQIIITELPYQVNKQRLIAKIAQLVKDGKIKGISDIKDLSNKDGIHVSIELKRDAKPKTVENKLYKFTELQKAFNANVVALVDGEPLTLNLKQILTHFIQHRQVVIIRRNEFDLGKKREREHILEGLMIALDNLDEVISTIRNSKDVDTARTALISKFKLTEIQAQAILDMQLRRLAALERQKIEEEYKEILAAIKDILSLLNDPKRILAVITEELKELANKYGDDRRTKVIKGQVGEISEEDLVAKEDVIVTISEKGYIKRFKDNTYKSQGRGGVGKKAMTTKEDDAVRHVFFCNTHDEVLVFTNRGRVFSLRVYDIPEYNSRSAKGVPVINLVNISQGELVTSVLTRGSDGNILDEDITQEHEQDSENQGKGYKYLFMATRKGIVKKTEIKEFENIRTNGLISINLDDDDELIWVKPTNGDNFLMLVTRLGKSIHFSEKDVRETGRATRGVRGINLKETDQVISMDVIRNLEEMLLTISEKGYGKVTKLEQFATQGRGGSGIFAHRVNDKTGSLSVARVLDHPDLELLIMSAQGQAVRVATAELPERNRQTSGVRMMKIKGEDKVVAIAII